jgi:Holliday junction DNA helicase RuvA
MISRIEGTILYLSEKYAVLDTSGVGYKVFILPESIGLCKLGDKTSFWTYLAVRENSLDLYGFKTIEEMNFFELLLDVSGIGPKSALSILSVASIETLQKAIATSDTSYLTKVSGIGRKTAEKIVIELRDKLKAYKNIDGSTSLRDEGDVIEVLKSLGYSQQESRDVIKRIPETITDTKSRIKEALRLLATRT